MMNTKLWVFLVLSFAGVARAETASLRSIWLNRQASQALREQKPEEALEKWSRALETAPDTAEIHLNMGLAFEALGQSEKALQSFRTADRLAQSREVQFLARFNQGALYQKAKKVDEALEAYHAALDVAPESRETKINIELLIQQQQQQKGQGEGQQNQNQPQQGNQDQKKDKGSDKDQQQDSQGQGDDKKKQDQPKQYAKNKPQPKPFNSKEMDPSQAKKILGEILNQEQRIRAEYNKREVKEKPHEKDW